MITDFSNLETIDFDLKNTTVTEFTFKNFSTVSYREQGRQKNLLHLITGGCREYSYEGQRFTLPAGTVLLIPDNTHYETTAYPREGTPCSGIGICFDLMADGKKLELQPGIYFQWERPFTQAFEELKKPAPIFRRKLLIARILESLIGEREEKSLPLIRPALVFIQNHYRENLPVGLYAEKCGLSESYFRKVFLKCTGLSPLEYRNQLRFREAEHLYREHYTLQELAELLGFYDAGYLAKIYKKYNGSSLKKNVEEV